MDGRWLGYFSIFMGSKMATDGVLRGLGIMRAFLIANMVNLAIPLSVALICAPRFGIAFVWLAVPAGWLANFLISYHQESLLSMCRHADVMPHHLCVILYSILTITRMPPPVNSHTGVGEKIFFPARTL